MPISNEEFEETVGDAATNALNFLKQNRDRGAFSLTEIMEGIKFKGASGDGPITLHEIFRDTRHASPPGTAGGRAEADRTLKHIMDELVTRKLVQVKSVSGRDYYRAV